MTELTDKGREPIMDPPDLRPLMNMSRTEFSRIVPTESKLYRGFFNRDHSIRRQFVTYLEEDSMKRVPQVNITFYDDDGCTLLPEFLDENGAFDPVVRYDGTFIEAEAVIPQIVPSTTTGITDTNAAMLSILAKAKSKEGMPSLYKFDGNPATWYAWRQPASNQ